MKKTYVSEIHYVFSSSSGSNMETSAALFGAYSSDAVCAKIFFDTVLYSPLFFDSTFYKTVSILSPLFLLFPLKLFPFLFFLSFPQKTVGLFRLNPGASSIRAFPKRSLYVRLTILQR